MSDQNEKADRCANSDRPDLDSAPREKAETAETLTDATQSVKRAEPWLTLGLLRDDLKIVRALLEAKSDPGNVELALRRTLRALGRVGDGELTAEGWAR